MGVNIPRRGRGAAARSRPAPATLRFSHVGHACAFEWLGGVPRECVYENLRAVVARLRVRLLVWSRRPAPARPLRLLRDRVSAGDAAREGLGRSGMRYLKTGFWPARRFAELRELDAQYADWRDRTVIGVRTRPLALPSPSGSRRSEQGCGRYRRCASTGPDIARRGCRSTATCATAAARAIGRLSDWGHERVEAALQPRPGLDRPPRCRGRALPRAVTSKASGCRRESCDPSPRSAGGAGERAGCIWVAMKRRPRGRLRRIDAS